MQAQPSSDEKPEALEVPGGDIFGFTSPSDVGDPYEPDDLGLKYQIKSTNRPCTRTAHEHELSATD